MKILCGQYRKDDAHDPEMYAAAMIALFTDYPRDIIEYACDPRTGFASRFKWLPNIFEAREFLDDLVKVKAAKANPTTKLPPSAPLGQKVDRPMVQANVFIVEGTEHYAKFVAMHEAHGGRQSCFETRNGRNGLWVPYTWCKLPIKQPDGTVRIVPDGSVTAAYAAATALTEERKRQEQPAPAATGLSSVGDFG